MPQLYSKFLVHGEINSEYALGLEHDVPALLSEARLAMLGDW